MSTRIRDRKRRWKWRTASPSSFANRLPSRPRSTTHKQMHCVDAECFQDMFLFARFVGTSVVELYVLFTLVCIFQTIYRLFIYFGCVDFDCHFMQNSTSEAKSTQVHKDDVSTGNAVFSVASFAADLSYVVLVCSFLVAKRMDSALVAPSETLTKDLNNTDVTLLFFTFAFINSSLLSLAVSFYLLPSSNEMRNPSFSLAEIAGTAGQVLVHWTSINTCHVFAVSTAAIGKDT